MQISGVQIVTITDMQIKVIEGPAVSDVHMKHPTRTFHIPFMHLFNTLRITLHVPFLSFWTPAHAPLCFCNWL